MKKLIIGLSSCILFFGGIQLILAQYSPPVPDYLIKGNYFEDIITNFDIDIIVNKDRSLRVVENIEIYNAEVGSIQRGIFRDFPTLYKNKLGLRDIVRFEVISVMRDGNIEPYVIEGIEGGKRIRIGNANYYLPVGKYKYTIEYKVDQQIRSFSDKDELYYNLVGTDWEFAIEQINARIHFPQGLEEDNFNIIGYTGVKGSTSKDFEYKFDQELNILSVYSTRRYNPYEGLTISASFPKGYVINVSIITESYSILSENILSILAFIISVILFIYYYFIWISKGRDVKVNTVIPLYEPPKDLTPAQIRYLDKLGYDNKVMTVEIISMAIKGYWKIIEEKGEFILHKLNNEFTKLSSDEQILALSFFDSPLGNINKARNFTVKFFGMEFKTQIGEGAVGDKFKLNAVNHSSIQYAIDKLKKNFDKEVGKKYILSNSKYYLIGFGFYLILGILLVIDAYFLNNSESLYFLGNAIFWNGIVSIFIFGVIIPGWIKFWTTKKGIFETVSITLFMIPFECVGLFLIWLAYSQGVSLLSMLALFIPIPMFVIFYKALKVRNLDGVKLQNQIDGFKMFLKATEGEQLKYFNKQLPQTFETYQKYLPYAVALDLETQWTEKFNSLIQLYSQNHDDTVGWYSGSVMAFSSSSFASNLSSSISSSISSSSSSGSSGGSSGGGGGGGGGGGW
ncbi:DUF2207 domain-containing protein [Candidatus Dojkabacteria bacterium]|nr:DUF2207 domain-containing protein [Candidatus Dojkabacteria bacterium]